MPLVTQGTRGYQHHSLPSRSQGDTNSPLLCGGRPLYQMLSKEIPTLLMSHNSTPGDTNTPVNTAERLTLIQRQPYRLCRTYRLFSFRLTLHTEESLSGRQRAKVFQINQFYSCNSDELLISNIASYTALYMPLKHLTNNKYI